MTDQQNQGGGPPAYAQALALGFISGLRAMLGPAFVSEIAPPNVRLVFRLLSAGELVADKLPRTPSRIDPGPLVGRIVSGTAVGYVVCRRARQSIWVGILLGGAAASIVFAVALLASGQNSTVTGTLAGQIVMEGFLHLRMPVWLRRMVTRAIAIVPAVAVVASTGDAGATKLLVLSQVVLSLQLPFAVVPLIQFVGDRRLMGRFAIGPGLRVLAWTIAGVIVALNAVLIYGML